MEDGLVDTELTPEKAQTALAMGAGFPWDAKFGGWLIKETDDWFVMVMPMLFNDRVVIGTQDERIFGYSAGWCYDKGGAALLAAAAWDPVTQDEPAGYKKAAIPRDRRYV